MSRANRKQVNALESVAAATFSNASYGAFEFLPPFPRNDQSGDFYKYELGNYFTRSGDTTRAEDGTASELKRKVTLDSYSTKEHAKKIFLGDIEEAISDEAVRPSRTATFDVVNQIWLAHEMDVKDFFDDDTNFGSVIDLGASPTDQWDDYDNSDPEQQMLDIRLTLLPWLPFGLGISLPKIKLGLTPEAYVKLLKHPRFIDRYKNTDGDLGRTQLAEYMKVGQIVVLESYRNTVNEGVATQMEDPTMEAIWSDVAILAYVDPTPTWGNPTFGFSPTWRIPGTNGLTNAIDNGRGLPIRVRDYRDEARGGGGSMREADAFIGKKIVFPFLGVKIKSPVS